MSKVCFGDVVRDVKVNIDRSDNPYEYYVAGDHMDTEELRILRRGRFSEPPEPGPAFIRGFKAGQILYGSRRTYLKKVAVADFDGICANTTFVLESKDEGVFLQRLLPFLMYSERFTKFSIKNSKGSTNPYILFSDLAKYEFDLPPIPKQRKLADLLWAANATREAYKKLLFLTGEAVKSGFVEMFGNPMQKRSRYPNVLLESIAEIASGVTKGRKLPQEPIFLVPYMRVANVKDGFIDFEEIKYIEATEIEIARYRILPDDVLLTEGGDPDQLGRGSVWSSSLENCIFQNHIFRVRLNRERILPLFFSEYLKLPQVKQYFLLCAKQTTGIASINMKQLKSTPVMVPPIPLQARFVELVRSADKSEFIAKRQVGLISRFLFFHLAGLASG